MDTVQLGNTGLSVTRLCLGTLPMRQADMSPEAGGEVIVRAAELGINFVDTARNYVTYEHVRLGRKKAPWLIVGTKSHAATYEQMDADVQQAFRELDMEVIDSFMIHAARSKEGVLQEREAALECLLKYKEQGRIKAVGISTHFISVVREAAQHPDIDVIHPLINMAGFGLADGTASDMAAAIKYAADIGKGIYAMKSLAGGNLIPRREEALRYVLDIEGVHSVAVGMVSEAEIMVNIAIAEGRPIPAEYASQTKAGGERWVLLDIVCTGCGTCVDVCPSAAVTMVNGRPEVDPNRCVVCRYCGPECPSFAIRFV